MNSLNTDSTQYAPETFQNDLKQPPPSTTSTFSLIILIILLIYFISGLLAFITSLFCFGYGGSVNDKAFGLLIAWVTGPFYWLYFIYNSEYCTRSPAIVYYTQPPVANP